ISAQPKNEKKSALSRWRRWYLTFGPEARSYLAAGALGSLSGFFLTLGDLINDRSGFPAIVAALLALLGLWIAAKSNTTQTAAVSGSIFPGSLVVVGAMLAFITQFLVANPASFNWVSLFFLVPLGGFVGAMGHRMFVKNREKFGATDPLKQRQELLTQLLEIQDRLHQDTRFCTFLSVDIVGSSKLKQNCDPLAMEFTFTEYHKYVESIVKRFDGRVHSTAGDGVTCAFDSPEAAFTAGKALIAGLFEFNAARNKIGRDIELRAGIHTGTVSAAGQDVTKVNFAEVIDLAAHLQKAAPPGGLAVSQTACRYLKMENSRMAANEVQLDGHVAMLWRPRRLQVHAPSSSDGH
ncbi:MAG: adenylate/guanylate cyclase domain-containing protein, partial [Fimbriimonadaceae bacterium]